MVRPTPEEVGLFVRGDHRSQMLAVMVLARRASLSVREARSALREAAETMRKLAQVRS